MSRSRRANLRYLRRMREIKKLIAQGKVMSIEDKKEFLKCTEEAINLYKFEISEMIKYMNTMGLLSEKTDKRTGLTISLKIDNALIYGGRNDIFSNWNKLRRYALLEYNDELIELILKDGYELTELIKEGVTGRKTKYLVGFNVEDGFNSNNPSMTYKSEFYLLDSELYIQLMNFKLNELSMGLRGMLDYLVKSNTDKMIKFSKSRYEVFTKTATKASQEMNEEMNALMNMLRFNSNIKKILIDKFTSLNQGELGKMYLNNGRLMEIAYGFLVDSKLTRNDILFDLSKKTWGFSNPEFDSKFEAYINAWRPDNIAYFRTGDVGDVLLKFMNWDPNQIGLETVLLGMNEIITSIYANHETFLVNEKTGEKINNLFTDYSESSIASMMRKTAEQQDFLRWMITEAEKQIDPNWIANLVFSNLQQFYLTGFF